MSRIFKVIVEIHEPDWPCWFHPSNRPFPQLIPIVFILNCLLCLWAVFASKLEDASSWWCSEGRHAEPSVITYKTRLLLLQP